MNSEESSPASQFKSINFSAVSLLYDPTLTSVHDYWKNHSFDYPDLCRQSGVSASWYTVWVCLGLLRTFLVVKNLPASARDIRKVGLVPGSGWSPGGGNGSPLQYSCLENPMDWGAWWAAVYRVAKSRTWLKRLNTRVCYSFPSRSKQLLNFIAAGSHHQQWFWSPRK